MSVQKTTLKDNLSGDIVEAELHDALSLDDIYDAEAEWASARVRIRQKVKNAGSPVSIPESCHWDWSKKIDVLDKQRLSALGDVRIVGIRHNNQWQGVVWVETSNRHGKEHLTRLNTPGRNLAYIPWFETAPWNWDVPSEPPNAGTIQKRCFRGLGILLMTHAVIWSDQQGFKGRVGLHSLPQAEQFYGAHCMMSDLGPDPMYQGLRYFELDETQARTFLKGK